MFFLIRACIDINLSDNKEDFNKVLCNLWQLAFSKLQC